MPRRWLVALLCVWLGGCSVDAAGTAEAIADGAPQLDSGSTDDSSAADSVEPNDTATPDSGKAETSIGDGCKGDGGPCYSFKGCNSGVFQCDGSCSAAPDPPKLYDKCGGPSCGTGTIKCDGLCSVPDDPAGLGGPCTSGSCTNGTMKCTGCVLPAGAKEPCAGYKCSGTVYSSCDGVCPPKFADSGKVCRKCCSFIGSTDRLYDDCGACEGCPFGYWTCP